MTIKIQTRTFQLAKAETQLGVVARVIDLGLQPNNFFGTKDSEGKEDGREFIRQLSVAFELPNDTMESGEQKGLPLMVSKDFTASMHKRAGLRKLVNASSKKDLTDAEANDIDVESLIGRGVLLQIEHYTNKKNQTGVKVGNIMRLDSRTVVPALVNPPIVISADSSLEAINSLKPDWLKDKVLKGRIGAKTANQEF